MEDPINKDTMPQTIPSTRHDLMNAVGRQRRRNNVIAFLIFLLIVFVVIVHLIVVTLTFMYCIMLINEEERDVTLIVFGLIGVTYTWGAALCCCCSRIIKIEDKIGSEKS